MNFHLESATFTREHFRCAPEKGKIRMIAFFFLQNYNRYIRFKCRLCQILFLPNYNASKKREIIVLFLQRNTNKYGYNVSHNEKCTSTKIVNKLCKFYFYRILQFFEKEEKLELLFLAKLSFYFYAAELY